MVRPWSAMIPMVRCFDYHPQRLGDLTDQFIRIDIFVHTIRSETSPCVRYNQPVPPTRCEDPASYQRIHQESGAPPHQAGTSHCPDRLARRMRGTVLSQLLLQCGMYRGPRRFPYQSCEWSIGLILQQTKVNLHLLDCLCGTAHSWFETAMLGYWARNPCLHRKCYQARYCDIAMAPPTTTIDNPTQPIGQRVRYSRFPISNAKPDCTT